MGLKPLAAELVGTFAYVLAVCGTALLAAPAGGGLLAVALAAGLAMTVMAYSLGHISGGHFNPSVTIGLMAGGRFDGGNAVGYVLAQVLGGLAAAFVLQTLLAGALSAGPGVTTKWNDLATISNTYGGQRGFSMTAAIVVEVVATALYIVVFMGATSKRAPADLAPLAAGAGLAVLCLLAIPVTNASLNPARSTATAVLAGGAPLAQLWVFWVAPIAGAIIGGGISRWLESE